MYMFKVFKMKSIVQFSYGAICWPSQNELYLFGNWLVSSIVALSKLF